MGLNIGYLTSDRTPQGDEVYTPFYAVAPILKYVDKNKKIWCPFDENWSAFYQTFKENGYNVIRRSLKEGQDFFNYEPADYDIIISNPPFSKKDYVLKRLDELGKPFMLLLPVNSIQGSKRYDWCYKNGIEMLAFDKRIDYHTWDNFQTYTKGNHFGSAYFCRNVLPKSLIVEKLDKFERPLKEVSENDRPTAN